MMTATRNSGRQQGAPLFLPSRLPAPLSVWDCYYYYYHHHHHYCYYHCISIGIIIIMIMFTFTFIGPAVPTSRLPASGVRGLYI